MRGVRGDRVDALLSAGGTRPGWHAEGAVRVKEREQRQRGDKVRKGGASEELALHLRRSGRARWPREQQVHRG